MCMDLEHRSMPYSNVQQSIMQELHKCSKTWRKPRRIQNFSEWPGGQGKVMLYISYRDMSHFFKHTVKPGDGQPVVLITAPTGSVAFQIGGSTIHSAFLLHDKI